MTRIFLDCSKEFVSPDNKGIDRVVRNLYKSEKFTPVIFYKDEFYLIPNLPEKIFDKNKKEFSIKSFIIYLMNSIPSNRIKFFFEKFSYYRKVGRFEKKIKKIDLKKGDILLFPDIWGPRVSYQSLCKIRDKGIKVGFVLYDLIPVEYPEFYEKNDVLVNKDYIKICTSSMDFFISISQTVKNKYDKYLQERGVVMRGDYFYLGNDIKPKNDNVNTRSELIALLAKPTYMVVSSFEPRKNHLFVLKAFEKLWLEENNIQLLFIGGIGWKSKDLLKYIKEHKEFGKRLFVFHDINDTELDFSYRHATALITASKDEGFNLPIVEAINYKLPVIASNIPINKEVGGQSCIYFSLDLVENLTEIIKNSELVLPSVENRYQINWEESAGILRDKIIKLTS